MAELLQSKIKVHCPDCECTSVTSDPYIFLSVQVPTEKYKVIEYMGVEADTRKKPKMHVQKMLKVADIGMLKHAVGKKHVVKWFFVCDVWKIQILCKLRRHDSVRDINRKSDDIFIYHSPRPDLDHKGYRIETKRDLLGRLCAATHMLIYYVLNCAFQRQPNHSIMFILAHVFGLKLLVV